MSDNLDRLKAALADRYAIQGKLGEGGMATVYLAEDLKHHRKVAVKVLRPELSAILGAERFLKEIEVTANLQHPNILPLYDSGEADTFLYYVMPYIEGDTLRDKLDREKQLGVEEAVKIGEAVASALQYAHEHDIVHRDIKPENILLQSGQALVADFGIALAVRQAGGTRLTETGLALGTPHYMSPEQAAGDREVDARSDIYSLGAMVYESLTGDPPHTGNTLQAIVAKVLSEEPTAIAKTRHTVPPHVEAAVHKALAKVPADRFATAAQFAEALTSPGFMPPTPSREITGVRMPTAWSRLTVAFASLSGVLAALLLVVLWSGSRPGPAPRVARLSLRLPPEEALGLTARPGLALAPDGSRFVYVGLNEGTVQLFLRELGDLHARPLRGTEDGCCAMFSPDGQSVAFMSELGELKVVSLGGGPVVTVVDSGLPDLPLYGGGVDWGPDGFLYVSGLEGLVRVASPGDPLERVTTLDRERGDRGHASPDVLPNGKGALVTVIPQEVSDGSAYAIGVADFATGAVDIVLQGIYARYAVSGHVIFVQDDGTVLAAPFDQDRLEVTGPAVPLVENVQFQSVAMAQLALSETGSLLYATGRPPVNRLMWVDRDGGAEEIEPGWTGDFLDPVLSRDESRIAVSILTAVGRHVWIKPLDGSPASRLTFAGAVNLRVAWTLDDQSVMFVSDRSGESLLYQKRADGATAAIRIPLYDERPVFGIEPSRDGSWLIFRTDNQAPGRGDILAVARGDTVPVELIATPAEEVASTLSPDGRWLAYTSDESGRREVYVRPFPNVSDARRQVSTSGGSEPLWAHSGRELFYRTSDNNLIAVQVVRDPAFSLGTQRRLFSVMRYKPDAFHRAYDVARDDQRFLMIRQEVGEDEGELILVLNWLEEVKRQVGNE